MAHFVRTLLISFIVCTLILGSSVTAQEPPPGTATGEKIGTIIKMAIDTALPAVPQILSLIWGNKSDKEKVDKKQLQEAVTAAREQMRKDFTENALTKIQPVRKVADELDIIYRFMGPATDANESIVKMQTLLSSNTAISDALQKQLDKEWGFAARQLATLNQVSTKDIDKTVRDRWLREKLSMIKDLNKRMVDDIKDQIAAKSASELRSSLKDASNVLIQIHRAAQIEISDLQSDISGLADLGEGSADANTVSQTAALKKSVDTALVELNGRMPKAKQ